MFKSLFLADMIGATSFYVIAKCLLTLAFLSPMVPEVLSLLMRSDLFLDWYASHNGGLPFSGIASVVANIVTIICLVIAGVVATFLWLLARQKLSRS